MGSILVLRGSGIMALLITSQWKCRCGYRSDSVIAMRCPGRFLLMYLWILLTDFGWLSYLGSRWTGRELEMCTTYEQGKGGCDKCGVVSVSAIAKV
jgi:hypothetical protein